MAGFRLPDESQRKTIVGRTGTGKTHYGLWVLSLAPFDRIPYVIINYKGDKMIGDIPWLEEVDYVNTPPPKHPGLYQVRPHISHEDEIEAYLWGIWEKEKIGVFLDEGYMINSRSKALRALYVQGRAKKIPVITLSQRPFELSRFALSEADYFAVFQLNDQNDQKRVREFSSLDASERMPKYHSRWYDVSEDTTLMLSPAPSRDTILERFDDRLAPKKRAL